MRTQTTSAVRPRRRAAARTGILALLGAALVPLSATPADAAGFCQVEQPATLLADGCDDNTPPDTSVSASTAPNAAGLVNTSSMTFTVAAQVSDGDPGPFVLECKLTGPAQAHDWRACTSPVTYTGLPDAPAGSYVFAARAVDEPDSRTTAIDNPLVPPALPDTPDVDQSPATVTWGQDTTAPFVFVTSTSYDEATPTQPVVTTPTVPIRLNSNERGSSIQCVDNGREIPCSPGRWELTKPSKGKHTFSARSVDAAGNASAWSTPVEFFVPRNLRKTRGWTKVKKAGYYRGDAITTSRRGARVVLPRTTVGELRLIAPSGRKYGKVRLRVGKRDWHVVNLAGKANDLTQYIVIDRFSGIRKGKIVIETLSNKPVVIDAIVARPNKFPPATRTPARG